MNPKVTLQLTLAVITLGPDLAAADKSDQYSVRLTIKQTVNQEFRYDPKIREKAQATAPEGDQGVKMDPVIVHESLLRKLANQNLAQKKRAEEAKAFKFEKGGRLLSTKIGPLPAEIGVWNYVDPIPDARAGNVTSSAAKWDILHLRF